ncbi:NAD(P)/FAD-dependent oxidoreductase [Aspergillus lucknowensis]|uniref:FAD/NAD(P)-binding domain-containing protein n=1 Tax=Aspergillus lucknowensis TaxID=176173 RepID=A0ABR4LSA3_9EURO
MPQQIVVIGAGFSGVWSALSAQNLVNLAKKENEVEILVISPKPVLVMRPRLYEANASTLVHPLESLFRNAGIRFVQGLAGSIDTTAHTVEVRPTNAGATPTTIHYDRLILAAGSSVVRPDTIPGLREHAFDIDSLDAAVKLESHLESLASLPASPSRDTIVVCGAGFTGIEIAAELPKRITHTTNPRVILVSNADAVAPDFGARARPLIKQALTKLGVELKLGSAVTAVNEDSVTLSSGERIDTKTAIWTAGVKATPLTQQIPALRDALSRLHVDEFLRVSPLSPETSAAADDIFATGDAAYALADGRENYALMSCQHAIPLGRVAGYNAAAELLGKPLIAYSQPAYNCCIDIGGWGAVLATGWQRDSVALSAGTAKHVKNFVNRTLIYPPTDAKEALARANPAGLWALGEWLSQFLVGYFGRARGCVGV